MIEIDVAIGDQTVYEATLKMVRSTVSVVQDRTMTMDRKTNLLRSGRTEMTKSCASRNSRRLNRSRRVRTLLFLLMRSDQTGLRSCYTRRRGRVKGATGLCICP